MKLKNMVFNFISNTVYYLIGGPILTIVNKVFLGYKIIGRENLKKVQGGKVTISNHMHYLDCTMNGLMNFPNFVHFVILESNFKIPVAGFLIKLLKAIPIPTDKSKKKHFYEYVSKLLQDGETVHIYPEGELKVYNQNLMDFKKGAFVFAVENNVPVVPTVFVIISFISLVLKVKICDISIKLVTINPIKAIFLMFLNLSHNIGKKKPNGTNKNIFRCKYKRNCIDGYSYRSMGRGL